MKYIFTTLLILFIFNNNLTAQESIARKILGIWQIIGKSNTGYLIFVNDLSGAVTSNTGLLQYYFDYQLASGQQPSLITEHFPIYNDKQYAFKGLVQLKNDSILLINSEIKGNKALLMEGKKVTTYKRLSDESIETFIRKPNQGDLIGTWLSGIKKDTGMSLTFKSNNTVDITNATINKTFSTLYKVDFNKQRL